MQDARHGLSPAVAPIDQRLVRIVPADARRILLIAPNPAGYGAELRRARPTASFFAPGPAVAGAPPWLVFAGADGSDWAQADGLRRFGPFDAILVDGAVEAAPAPAGFLKTLAEILGPAGTLALKVANVHHWSRVATLLAGTWGADAAPAGLSDEELRRGLRAAGLESADWRKIQDDAEAASPLGAGVLSTIEAALPAGARRNWVRERIAITHYLVAAMPTATMPRPILVHQRALGPLDKGLNASVARVRLTQPGTLLETFPGVRTRLDTGNQLPDATVRESDRVFIWQRILYRVPNQDALRRFNERGYVTVIEFDDHPTFFTTISDGGRATFSSFHAVQTSTPELADYIRQFNPEVRAFNNQVPALDPLPAKPDGPVRVLFAAINRKAGWERMVDAYREAVASGLDVRTVVVGDRGFFDALGPIDKEFLPILEFDQYQELVAGAHIALLPLADTVFDSAKTDLKFIECAARGTVVLASPVVYGKSVRDGETGFIYRSPEEFTARLRLLATDHERRRQMALAAYDYVREERMLALHIRPRLEWYRSLVARREALHAAAMERLGAAAPVPG